MGAIDKEKENKKQDLEKLLIELTDTRNKIFEEYEIFRSLIENMNIGIFRSSGGSESKFTEVNPAMARIFGYRGKQELLAANPVDLYVNPYDRTLMLKKLGEEGSFQNVEINYKKKDGSTITCSVSAVSQYKKSGQIDYFDGSVEDITERKKAERVQDIMYNISNAVNITVNLNDLIITIQNELSKLFDTSNFFIAFYNKEDDTLSMPFFVDEKDAFNGFPAKQTLTGYMIRSNRPILMKEQDINKLVSSGEIEDRGTPSKIWLGVPLNLRDEIIGALVVQNYEDEQAYTEKDLEILKFVSAQISLSIATKRASDQVQVEKAYFEQLFEGSPETVVLTANDGKLLRVNSEFERLFGYTQEEAIGKYIDELIVPEELSSEARKILQEIAKGEKIQTETIRKHKDGRIIHVSVQGTPIEIEGKQTGLYGIYHDITARKNAEITLRESEELFNNITTSAQDAIVVIDNDGNVIFWNRSAEKIFGYKAEEITGKNFHDLLVPDEYREAQRRDFSRFKKAGKGNEVGATLELEALNRRGQKFPVELSLSAMKIKDQWHSVAIIRDITQRKIIEGKLEEAKTIAENANRAKSEFLANMSHEIRTPMNAILGFAEILEEQLRDNPQNHEYIKGISNSGRGLLGLINGILDLSKIEAGKLDINYEPINPYTIIEEIRQVFMVKTREKKLDFTINVDPKLPSTLIFDETRLRQVLFNLIGNAIKFTSEGGIAINVKSKDSNAERSHVDLSVEVIDTGIGIHENEQQIIFEPFRQKEGQSTRKYGGTGLGLSITQRLVNIMGGTIGVKSTPGQGSTFSVFLPGIQVSALSKSNSGQDEEALNISFQNPLILLVEDIESNRKVIRGYLNAQNITIVEAENGSIGIEKAKEQIPDLILMDMQMPVMDGYEAIRVIKSDKKLKKIPVVALTASTMKRDATEIARLCDGYLRKPVSKSQLLSELKKFLPHTEEKHMIDEDPDHEGGFLQELIQRLSGDNDIPDDFIRVLNFEIIPEYNILLKNRSKKRIRNFAELVTQTGLKLHMEMIEAYGKELHAQVNAFNVQRINSMLQEFETLTKAINEVKP
ncbi:MAG: PAS domain S-box protein [Bacteroidales bacterium]|nr:PAS domain S-box protein [Bacteroidales bacterium]